MITKTYAFFSHLLVLAFLISPVVEASSGPDLKPVITKYKSYKVFKDLTPETTFEKEVMNYIQKENLLEEKLPTIELKDDTFQIEGDVKTIVKVVSTQHPYKIHVKANGQSVTLDSTLSPEAMAEKILPLYSAKSFTFMNLFISDAHAVVLPVLAVGAVVAVIGMIIHHLDTDNFKTANMELERLETLCPKDGTLPRNKTEQSKLKRTLEKATAKIEEIRIEGCQKIKSLNIGKLKQEKTKTCEVTLPRVQACFENIQTAFDEVNDSDRAIVKDTERSNKKKSSTQKGSKKL